MLDPKQESTRARNLMELLEVLTVEIAKDGGTISLTAVNYETGVVEVALGGACGTCSLTGTTLEEGVVRILTQRLDWVTEVKGMIDTESATTGQGGWQAR